MITFLARNWWALAIRGVAAVLFGIIALAWPERTLGVLIIVFGAYALVDGAFALVSAVRAVERHDRWGVLLLEGAAGIIAGIVALVAPMAAAVGFFFVFIWWVIATGILEIVAAVKLRKAIANEWLMVANGVLSIALGLFLAANPRIGIDVLVWCIGIYAILFGVMLVALSFRLRKLIPSDVQPTHG